MSDLEMTRLCAEAMGWRFWWSKHNHWNADGPNGERWGGPRWYAFDRDDGKPVPKPEAADGFYDFLPLTDDAQAMALDAVILLDNHGYQITPDAFTRYSRKGEREVFTFRADMTKPENRRRARVECVAKMQEAKNV